MGASRILLGVVLVLGAGCATELRERQAQDLFARAFAQHVQANLAGAEAGYRESLALAPSSAAANNLGVVHARQGRLDAARRWFDYAAAIDAGDLTPRINLGVVLFHLGRTGPAADTLLDARRDRQETLDHIAPIGRINWDADRYASATATADGVAARYLDRLMSTTAPPDPDGEELLLALTASRPR